jgi:hypothetical protein
VLVLLREEDKRWLLAKRTQIRLRGNVTLTGAHFEAILQAGFREAMAYSVVVDLLV